MVDGIANVPGTFQTGSTPTITVDLKHSFATGPLMTSRTINESNPATSHSKSISQDIHWDYPKDLLSGLETWTMNPVTNYPAYTVTVISGYVASKTTVGLLTPTSPTNTKPTDEATENITYVEAQAGEWDIKIEYIDIFTDLGVKHVKIGAISKMEDGEYEFFIVCPVEDTFYFHVRAVEPE